MASDEDRLARTRLLLGDEAMRRLACSHVAVFGVGGVGGHCIEALARSGVGELTIVDADIVDETNLNRQVIALESTVGRPKVDAMAERIAQIDPDCTVHARKCFLLPENAGEFDFPSFDYAVDCVDTVSAKLAIITCAKRAGVPVASSMGAGNKLDPTAFEIADIEDTSVDPLARVMRKELRRRGVTGVTVVYSKEPPAACDRSLPDAGVKGGSRPSPGSIAFVPSAAGLILASIVVKGLAGIA